MAFATSPTSRSRRRPAIERSEAIFCGLALVALLGLLASPLPREISALLVAATVVVSRTVPTRQLLGEIDLPLLILFAGLYTLWAGGEVSRNWSNRLMRMRVVAQAVAVLIILAVLYFSGRF